MNLRASDLYQMGYEFITNKMYEDGFRVMNEVIGKADYLDVPLHVIYNALGTAKLNFPVKDPVSALPYYEKALAGDPTVGLYWNNLAYCHMVANNPNRAITLCENAIKIQGDNLDAYVKLTNSLHFAKRPWEAYAVQIQSLLIKEDAHLRLGLGCTEMLLSDMKYEPLYRTGLSNYAYRNELSDHGKMIRPWGRDLRDQAGHRVALFLEQGLGDAVMMIPYVQELERRLGNGSVYIISITHDKVLEIYKALSVLPDHQLLTKAEFDARDKRAMGYPKEFWFMDLLSLGMPGQVQCGPVEYPDSPKSDKIGICWRGNKDFPNYHWRTIHFDSMKPFIREHGKKLVNLQLGLTDEEREFLTNHGVMVDDSIADFGVLFPLLKSLKKVVTSCTFISHISGILGVPCDTLLATFHDWRWGMKDETTPWYANHRILRQEVCGNWEKQLNEAGRV